MTNEESKYQTQTIKITKFNINKSLINDDLGDVVTVPVAGNTEMETDGDILDMLD